jgi:hypothetical protein
MHSQQRTVVLIYPTTNWGPNSLWIRTRPQAFSTRQQMAQAAQSFSPFHLKSILEKALRRWKERQHSFDDDDTVSDSSDSDCDDEETVKQMHHS